MQNKCTKRIKHYIRDVQNLEQRSQRPRKKTSIFAFTLCTALCVKDYTLPFVQEKSLFSTLVVSIFSGAQRGCARCDPGKEKPCEEEEEEEGR